MAANNQFAETNSSGSTESSNGRPSSPDQKQIFARYILPALISGFLGGGIVGVFWGPKIQHYYSTKQVIDAKKLDLFLATADAFSGWMTQWRRTERLRLVIDELEAKTKSSKKPSGRLA